jgi:hypothetical protein
MKSITRRLATIALSLGAFSAIAPSAMASSATILMQNLIFGSGTISYNATTQELTGTNIGIGIVAGVNTPLNSGAFSVVTGGCSGGVGCLNFTTGPLTSHTAVEWTFGDAGSLTVTGAAPGTGVPSSTTLMQLQGLFSDASVAFTCGGPTPIQCLASVTLQGGDTKAPGLLSYFGIPASEPLDFTSTFNAELPTGQIPTIANSFSASDQSAAVSNVAVGAIPEPSSVILLLTTLGATGFLYRARSRRSKKIAS